MLTVARVRSGRLSYYIAKSRSTSGVDFLLLSLFPAVYQITCDLKFFLCILKLFILKLAEISLFYKDMGP